MTSRSREVLSLYLNTQRLPTLQFSDGIAILQISRKSGTSRHFENIYKRGGRGMRAMVPELGLGGQGRGDRGPGLVISNGRHSIPKVVIKRCISMEDPTFHIQLYSSQAASRDDKLDL